MTGYGTASADAPGVRIVVEIRGVNQRHLDVRVSGAREYVPWEAEVREAVKGVADRGRVDVQIVRLVDPSSRRYRVAVREDLASAYVRAAQRLGRRLGVAATLPMADVLRLPEMVEVLEDASDPRRELPALRRALAGALRGFAVQREREGRHLARDMRARVAVVAKVARDLRRGLPEAREVVRGRLEERITRLAAGIEVEPARLAHEVATIVERGDVTEEVVRLEGHVAALRSALGEDGPVGKRIEFLLQEVQRELNTTGSKAATPALAALALCGKEEVEKLREQVQNVE